MRNSLSLFIVGLCLAPIGAIDSSAADAPAPGTVEAAFRSVLTPEQAASLSGRQEIERLARVLDADQRTRVRKNLAALESEATSSAVRADIQRAYRLLNTSVYVLRGEELAQSGRYEEAVAQAREALRRDPSDRSALALLKMNEGRTSRGAGFAPTAPAPAVAASSAKAQPGESKFLYQLRLHFRAGSVPPLDPRPSPLKVPGPLLPLGALAGAGLAYGAARKSRFRALLAGAVACAGLSTGVMAYRTATDGGMFGGELPPLLAGRGAQDLRCPKGMTATAFRAPADGMPGRTGAADPKRAAEIEACEKAEHARGRDGGACLRRPEQWEGGASAGGILNPQPPRRSVAYRCVADAKPAAETSRGLRLAKESDENSEGGLHLFKWDKETTASHEGWKDGDHMLYLEDKGTPKKNWIQNSRRLREAMAKKTPIFDSYRDPATGERIVAEGFLKAERAFLHARGWVYDLNTGAYFPPKTLGGTR